MANSVNVWCDKNGSLYLHVNYFSRRFKVGTGLRLARKQDFSQKRQRLKPSAKHAAHYNRALELLMSRVESAMIQAVAEGRSFGRADAQRAMFADTASAMSVIETFDKCVGSRRHELKVASIKAINNTRNLIQSFDKIATWADVNVDWAQSFVSFLVNKGLNNTTINKHLKNIRTVLRWGAERDYVDASKTKFFKNLKAGEAAPESLTHEELHQLIRYAPRIEEYYQRLSLDIFLLLCFTSMRVSEVNNIVSATLNNNSVEVYSSKMGRNEVKYVPPPAVKIFERYSYQLPYRAEQNINRDIKKIAAAAGLTRKINWVERKGAVELKKSARICDKITTHWGRRTFVTLMIAAGVPIANLKKLTGHSSTQVLERYNRSAFGTITRDLENIWS